MSKKNIYCGIGKIPKGYSLGSMKECASKKQIRYYGIKKIDPNLISEIKNQDTKIMDRGKLFIQISKINGKIKNLKNKIKITKNKDDKKKLENDLDKLINETN